MADIKIEEMAQNIALITLQELWDKGIFIGRWIPVSEELPEDGVNVLIYAERNAYNDKGTFRKKVIDIGWQVDGKWHIDGCNGVCGIAWMPLPEPYKAESEE